MVAERYEIRGLVGPRPLGTLYRAVDREIGVEVALRVIAPELLPDEAARQAFVGRLGRSKVLNHAHLVRLYEVRASGDEVFVAVQWAPGTPLSEMLKKSVLNTGDTRQILSQVAAAMAHAHAQGVVLGDVRAETVMLMKTDGRDDVKVANVGIAPALPRGRFLEAMRGTAGFERLAPEVRAGMQADARADVWALAALAVELTTGAPPTRPLTIPGAAGPLVTVLGRGLAEDPLLRPAQVETLAHDLDSVLKTGELPPRPRRPSAPPVFEAEETEAETRPTPLYDSGELGPATEALTRQVGEEELERLRSQDQEVTRRASSDELFALRLRSSDTQQIEMEMLVPYEDEPTKDDSLSLDEQLKTDQVPALPADDDRTLEVPRLDEQDVTPPPPPPPIAPEAVKPLALPRPIDAGDLDGTPLPPPAPAPPSPPQLAEEFGDESLQTHRMGRVSLEELRRMKSPAPAPARPPVEKPPSLGPRLEKEFSSQPKIETELPVEAAPLRMPPPSRMPPPPPKRPPVPIAVPPLVVPSAPPPPRATMQVGPIDEPKRGTGAIIAVVLVALCAFTAIGLGVAHHMRELGRQRERAEKQRLAGELNARAEAMRRGQAAPDLGTAGSEGTSPGTAPPMVTHPDMAPPEPAGPCPLGAKLVEAGRARFCIDLYEYPGGKTIPRTGVTFEEASRLCASRGQRLCSELEWERACRGKSGSSYPYGASYETGRCNTQAGELAAAGTFKDCRSASGAWDMSGNVAEWVVALKDRSPAQKGGSFQSGARESRCSHTQRGIASDGTVDVGFRCCSDPK
jgi:serine/threonine protein kinase